MLSQIYYALIKPEKCSSCVVNKSANVRKHAERIIVNRVEVAVTTIRNQICT